MFGLSFAEIAVILALALVVLGPKRLPQVARALGRGLKEIRRASEEVRGVWDDVDAPPRPPRRPVDPRPKLPAPGPAQGTVSAAGDASEPPAGSQTDERPEAHGAAPPGEPVPPADPSSEGGTSRGDA